MYLILIIIIVVCVLLGFIVMIQNPKGGGLSSNFSSSSQLMGVQKTGDFLEKGTWFLAIFLMVLSLALNVVMKSGGNTSGGNSAMHEAIQKASKPQNNTTAPFSGVTPPATQQQPQQATPAPVKK